MITVIQPNASEGATIIAEDGAKNTVIEDFETGEITVIGSESVQQTTLDRVEHTVTEIESNGTVVINNPIVSEVAEISASNATYLYFGFSLGGWKVRRVLRSNGADGIANGANNTQTDLSSAWASRETLNYT